MTNYSQVDKISLLLEEALENSVGNVAGSSRAVMFTGGFDSLLLARLAQRGGAEVTAITVQFEDFNPLTVATASELAQRTGISHHVIQVEAAEFLSAFEKLAEILDQPPMDLDLAVVYAALEKYDPKIAGKVFISGMGSDQWFGDVPAEGNMLEAVKMHQRVAWVHGYSFVFPFLSQPMRTISQQIPAVMKKDKEILRALSIAKHIPRQKIKREEQVPPAMRRLLIKVYGDRAWPEPIMPEGISWGANNRALHQIALGLWLEKAKPKTAKV